MSILQFFFTLPQCVFIKVKKKTPPIFFKKAYFPESTAST